jgi:hypothetical protein
MPGLWLYVKRIIDAESRISEKSLKDQFEKLILKPLSEIMQTSIQILTLVIVIDALDECEREGDIRTLLRLLPQVGNLQSVRMCIFLTSRSELPIRLGFKNMSADEYQDMVLEDRQYQT